MVARIIEGEEVRRLEGKVKWDLLSPHLKQHGGNAFSYATLQEGMEYFLDTSRGYIAYATITHPVFAPCSKRIVLGDPVCSLEDASSLVDDFLTFGKKPVFAVIGERVAELLREKGFKVNCIGFEPEIPLQEYNFQGNWKDLDVIKRARNEAKKGGLIVREENISLVDRRSLESISKEWLAGKKLNSREIWIYARPPIFEEEKDVRKFVAYDSQGKIIGFAFYDPMYTSEQIMGYSANIIRCDESSFRKLSVALNMEAAERFKQEGKQTLNLCIAPFDKVDKGRFNDDLIMKLFVQTARKYGDYIYNFGGLSFYKSKYRAKENPVYFASREILPVNDLYLSFLASDIAKSYADTMGKLVKGIIVKTTADITGIFKKT
jgi:lysylphosphatidylglycerol synthetase-like protein (DUF2156 family)